MPKKAIELSALAVSKLKQEGRYAVGGVDGLHLNIIGQSRVWILRVVVGYRTNASGKTVAHRRDIGLGSYPAVSLAEARESAREYRKKIRSGIDPVEGRQIAKARILLEAAKTKTFKECAEAYIQANRVGWKNEKHIQQWENTLATYVYPRTGDLPVSEIDTGMVLGVLQQQVTVAGKPLPLWLGRTETASRLRGRLETILDWAAFRKFRSGENPARWKGHLEHELLTPM